MLTSADIANRMTGAEASRVSGIPAGSLRRMRSEGTLPAKALDLADTLSLLAAQELVDLKVPTVRAAAVARSLSREDWERVIAESGERRFYLVARAAGDGHLTVAVADDREVIGCLGRGVLVVDLTAVGEKAFARLLQARRDEVS